MGSLPEGSDAPAVVLSDPILDGPPRAAHALGEIGGGPPLVGEDDGLDPTSDPFLGDGLGESWEVFQSLVAFDVHH